MHISCNGTQARIPTAQFASFYQVDSAEFIWVVSNPYVPFQPSALTRCSNGFVYGCLVTSDKISEAKVFQTAAKQTI